MRKSTKICKNKATLKTGANKKTIMLNKGTL